MSTTERAPQTSAAAFPRTLGDRLAKARKMAGLTFVQLHEKTGMARNSMPKYEADQTPDSVAEWMAAGGASGTVTSANFEESLRILDLSCKLAADPVIQRRPICVEAEDLIR